MALFLLELPTNKNNRAEVVPILDTLSDMAAKAGGTVIEVQIAADMQRAYIVIEHADRAALSAAVKGSRPAVTDIAEVRLVGATLESVKAAKGAAKYLVECDLPAGLSMEKYLARKKEKSPLYAQVSDVKFLRTYVREDMGKCLCFYDACDAAAVTRAREVVQAPIDRLSRLEGAGHEPAGPPASR
jgi:hypothetical protein